MTKYCDEVDITDEKTHGKLINLIGKNKKVLEIGCTNGRMSKFLAQNGCQVTGIEIDSLRAQTAKQFCSEVIIGDVEDESVQSQIKGTFDVVIFADVLEHLVYPEKILTKMHKFLNEGSFILISLPNVAYFTVRKKLLFGMFEYETKGGILDNEHLRFFTLDTAKKMILDCGYEIEYFDVISIPRFKKYRFIYKLSKKFPALFAYEFIFKIKPNLKDKI